MQIQFEQKKEFETRSIGSFDIHEIFSRFVALFDSKKQYLLETLDNLKTKSESEMDEIKMGKLKVLRVFFLMNFLKKNNYRN